MIEHELHRILACPGPPTPATIEQDRQQQLNTIKKIRRKLLEVLDGGKQLEEGGTRPPERL